MGRCTIGAALAPHFLLFIRAPPSASTVQRLDPPGTVWRGVKFPGSARFLFISSLWAFCCVQGLNTPSFHTSSTSRSYTSIVGHLGSDTEVKEFVRFEVVSFEFAPLVSCSFFLSATVFAFVFCLWLAAADWESITSSDLARGRWR